MVFPSIQVSKFQLVAMVGILVLVVLLGIKNIENKSVAEMDIQTVVNESGNSPLSATIYFKTLTPVRASVTILSKQGQSPNLVFSEDKASKNHKINIWGLYNNYTNTIVVSVPSKFGMRSRIKKRVPITGVVPYRGLKSTNGDTSVLSNYFILIDGEMYDRYGQIRWKLSLPYEHSTYILSDGLFATIQFHKGYSAADQKVIKVYDRSGYLIEQYYVPNGAHHDVIEKTKGGNLIFLSDSAPGVNSEDAVMELDRKTGKIVKSWDLRDVLDKNRFRWQKRSSDDWAHANSVAYDPDDKTLMVSLKLQNTIVKIDYNTGKAKWILAPHTYWGEKYKKLLLRPIGFSTDKDPNQDWTYLQHHATLIGNKDILIFDNGAGRPGFTDTPNDHGKQIKGGYARAVRFSIDEENMTVKKIGEWTDFPHVGSNNRGSAYVFGNDKKLLIGYSEFATAVVRGGNDWNTVFLKLYFRNTITAPRRSFYRVFPYFVGKEFTAKLHKQLKL